MIGILLLFVALWSYFVPRYRWFSYFLYVSFMTGWNGGFGLWTNSIVGMKNGDLAVIYTFIISFHLLINGDYKFPKFSFIKQYKWLIAFLCCSVVFSFVHYGFGLYDILQGSRAYFLFFSLPILCRMNATDFEKLMKALMWVTTITAILYILQIVMGRPLMPYGDGSEYAYSIDKSTGLIRLYNMPAFNTFFLTLSFVHPQYFGRKVNVFRCIFFIALISTLGRMGIFSGILTVMLAIAFTGKAGKTLKTAIIVGLLLLPFVGLISNRFEGGNTEEDLQTILKGGASIAKYERSEDATMTYRIAWVLERVAYLSNRPIGEEIFGLGLITDSSPHMKYRFYVGNVSQETGQIVQMRTPDIAYGNLISHWGFCGTIIYMWFVISFAIYLFKNRKYNMFVLVSSVSLIMLVFVSISGDSLSLPKNFVIYFIVLSTLANKQKITERI